MTVLTNTLKGPTGSAVVGAVVTASLVGGPFLADRTAGIVQRISTVTDASGVWQLDLTPTSLVEGTSYYVIREAGQTWTVAIPPAGPVKLRDALINAPVSPTVTLGLSRAEADTLYQPLGSGGGSGISQAFADGRYNQKTANLSDVANAGTARVNLGAAAASHTHAESDVTGLTADLASKLVKASNLSDVANAATALANLGVSTDAAAGTGSLRTLGTGAVQAAAGNHTHAGGGGGSAVKFAAAYVTTGTSGGDVNPNTAGVWAQLTGPGEIAVLAAVGELVEASARFLSSESSSSFYDLAIAKSGAVWYGSSNGSSPAIEGDPSAYPITTGLNVKQITVAVIATAGMIDVDGKVHFQLYIKTAGANGKTYYTANYPFRWRAMNYGTPG